MWRNSNIEAPVSYKGGVGFKEITFYDTYVTDSSISLAVSDYVFQNIQGQYLDCLATVEFSEGGSAVGYTKVKIP